MKRIASLLALCILLLVAAVSSADEPRLVLSWADNMLRIKGPRVPGEVVEVWYLEACCRPGSTDREWGETVIPHETELISASEDGSRIELLSKLADGVVIRHVIEAGSDEVDFCLVATNPTDLPSKAHWAQPCMRVDRFTGCTSKETAQDDYLPFSFVFLDGKLTRMPTPRWATEARYTPGQVWCPKSVKRDDVNPRPLSDDVPSNGLIGCFSADGGSILAMAWEPYQELFQGVIVCLHSDFRIGGLKPREEKSIRGKIYLTKADVPALVERYERDFPEHVSGN